MGQGCPKNEWAEDAQGIIWAEKARDVIWTSLTRMLGSRLKEGITYEIGIANTLAHKPRGNKVNKGKWYHSRNNAVAWQEHQPTHGQGMKGDIGQIKEEKAHTQAMFSPKKKWDAKNENRRTHSRHKS